jgi:trigger factor
MATAVENLDKLERRVTFTIPKAEVASEVEKRLKLRARTAKAPGFRTGKVPAKMVAAQYGYQIENDVLNEKIASAFNDIATQNDLRVAGYPRFEPNTGDDIAEELLAFNATFEVFPEVNVGDLSQAEVEKTTTAFTDAEVDKTIDILRKRQAHFHVKGVSGEHGDGGSDQTAQNGDRVTVDFVGKIDGVEFEGGKASDFVFVLGEGRMLPEFEAAALGMKAGESKDFPLSFPETYQGKDVAGKTAEFTLTMKQIEWAHLPEVNDEFAKALGIPDGNVGKMREDIKTNLLREVNNRLNAINKNKVMDALLKVSEFDVPKAMVDQEISQLAEMARRDMAQRNMDPKGIQLPPELFSAQAERRVRLGMILGKIMKDNNLAATPEKLRAKAEELASSYEQPEVVRDFYLNDQSRRSELEALVMEENVIEYVLGKAKVTEKEMPFDELMSQQA